MSSSTRISLDGEGVSMELAGRGVRLVAILIDGVIGLVFGFTVLAFSGGLEHLLKGEQLPPQLILMLWLIGVVAFFLVNSYPLIKEGQTIGKLVMGIRIVDLQGHVPAFWKIAFLRYLPGFIASPLGLVGTVFATVDSLLIFRQSRRCLHDVIAGTRVVKVEAAHE